MDHINNIVSEVINNFDFSYIIIVNVLTYLIINFIDKLNKEKVVSTWQKRGILLFSIAVVATIYLLRGYDRDIVLLNSSILAPVAWSWLIRPVCIKLGINYKNIDDSLS